MILNTSLKQTDALSVLNAAPGSYLILLPDAPHFTIVGVTDAYLADTLRTREDLIGKGVFEAFPQNPDAPYANGVQNLSLSLQYVVDHRKEHRMAEQRYDIMNHVTGTFEIKYWRPVNKPVMDTEGIIQYIIHWVEDVTEKVWLRELEAATFRKVKESEQNLRNMIMQSPVAMCILKGQEFIVEIANDKMIALWGRKREDLIHQPIFDGLPEAKDQGLEKLLLQVYTTGQTFAANEHLVKLPRNGKIENTYINFVYEPLRGSDDSIMGVMAVAIDVTDQVVARMETEKKAEEFRFVMDFMPVMTWHAGPDGSANFFNKVFEDYAGMSMHELSDWNWTKLLHPDDAAHTRHVWEHALKNGIYYEVEHRLMRSDGTYRWFITRGVPLKDEEGRIKEWYGTSADIQEQKSVAEELEKRVEERTQVLEEQKRLLDNILNNSPSGISVSEVIRNDKGEVVDGRTIVANAMSEQYLGISVEEMLAKKTSEVDPNILSSPLFRQALHTLETGQPFITQYFFEPAKKWLELSVSRMNQDRLINIFTDITPLKNVQLEIERSEERLKAVFNSAQSGMFTFAPVRDEKGEIIDFRFVITNPTFAAYVGQTPEVLNGQLGSTWFPGYLTNGVFDMYKRTYLTGEMHRTDIHYNVDQHDIYLDLQSTKVGDEVLITFTDFTPLKKAQLQLEKYIEDLKRSNANLEEFAYAASHDLKEPVRKIHFFSDRLISSLQDRLSTEQRRLFERMEAATKRMGSLIDDLLSYSQVSLKPHNFDEIDLNRLIETVLDDLDLEIEETGATVEVDRLFTIKGHQRQLQQAFHNLLGNALKYIPSDRKPNIRVSCNRVPGRDAGIILSPEELQKDFYMVSVSDNGIGFPQEDAERIFNVFTRLHNVEFRGTGIGLSIVRRVIENHNGYVKAEGRPGEGATFKVFLPISL